MEAEEEYVSSPPPEGPAPTLLPPMPDRGKNVESVPSTHHDYDIENEDCDDEVSNQMTASYSEISFKSGMSPDNEVAMSFPLDPNPLSKHILQRPITLSSNMSTSMKPLLGPLDLEGTIHVEGNMMHFVTEDLEYKIKLASPVTMKKGDIPPVPGNSSISRGSTPNTLYRQLLVPQVSQVNVTLLNDLESEAQRIATSIDNLTENLCGILHSMSSITADNVEIYKDSVSKMSDAMDADIKSMYTIVAKAEEVAQVMKLVHNYASRIKEIKRLVDLFENCL